MKFCGKIGYCYSREIKEGIWEDAPDERPAYGDVLQFNPRWDAGKDVLDDQRLLNKISIVIDAFAIKHVQDLKYVLWNDARWKVVAVEVLHPRLILTLGGVYNGPTPGPT